MKNPKVRQIILPLITAMIWGSSFVTQSLSAGHLGCFSFNALRSIPAALALLLLLLVVRRIRPREKYTTEEKRAGRLCPRGHRPAAGVCLSHGCRRRGPAGGRSLP